MCIEEIYSEYFIDVYIGVYSFNNNKHLGYIHLLLYIAQL